MQVMVSFWFRGDPEARKHSRPFRTTKFLIAEDIDEEVEKAAKAASESGGKFTIVNAEAIESVQVYLGLDSEEMNRERR